jgi:capsular polysaccharide biosynthesis protein
MDRVTHIVLQAEHLITNETVALAGAPPQSQIVKDMWDVIMPSKKINFSWRHQEVAVSELIFSCRAPLIHPFHSFLFQERLGVIPKGGLSMDEAAKQAAQRKVIVYTPRGRGHERNKGRSVINEEELINRLRRKLKERGRGETLVEFDNYEHTPTLEAAIKFFKSVRVLVGPHGGALYNFHFMQPMSSVIELVKDNHAAAMFWEMSSVLGMRYSVVLGRDKEKDIEIDVDKVIERIEQELDTTQDQLRDYKSIHIEDYPWNVDSGRP